MKHRHLVIAIASVAAGFLLVAEPALAARAVGSTHMAAPAAAAVPLPPPIRGPAHTGQPNQSCGSAAAPTPPGNAANAPGSAFNPNGQAGSVYAGQQLQNSRNSASVAQYDVACARP